MVCLVVCSETPLFLSVRQYSKVRGQVRDKVVKEFVAGNPKNQKKHEFLEEISGFGAIFTRIFNKKVKIIFSKNYIVKSVAYKYMQHHIYFKMCHPSLLQCKNVE
tara:strand:- start:75 stop:389 length:315 start_codon:yes stop_codon:yes gene_type:complete